MCCSTSVYRFAAGDGYDMPERFHQQFVPPTDDDPRLARTVDNMGFRLVFL
jgi:hypothetical protein